MEQQALNALSKILLTPQNLGIMVASWTIIAVSRRMFPSLFKKPIMIRLLPVLPILLCMALLWLPGLRPAGVEWGWMLILGILLGWGTGHLHKILKQTVLGDKILKAPEEPEEKPEEKPAEGE